MKIKGKIFIVTGASSGLGKSLALQLIAQGAHVVLAARNITALQKIIAHCAFPANAWAIKTDLSQISDLTNLIEQVKHRYKQIDGLINNAGTGFGGDLADLSEAEIGYTIQVNLLAPILLTKLVTPIFIAGKGGIIVNITSLAAEVPTPFLSVYSATKSGLSAFSQSIYRQNDKNIRVMTVFPGSMRTKMTSDKVIAAARQSKVSFSLRNPDRVAGQIVEDMRQGKAMSYPDTLNEKLQRNLHRYLPQLTDKIMFRAGHKIRPIVLTANRDFRKSAQLWPQK